MTSDGYTGWAILELMGHRRLAGYVVEQEIAGQAFLRLDVPTGPADEQGMGPGMSQFYSPAAVYCLTPCSEQLAREIAAVSQPRPVQAWELPRPPEPEVEVHVCEGCESTDTDPYPTAHGDTDWLCKDCVQAAIDAEAGPGDVGPPEVIDDDDPDRIPF